MPPESDEEKAEAAKKDEKDKDKPKTAGQDKGAPDKGKDERPRRRKRSPSTSTASASGSWPCPFQRCQLCGPRPGQGRVAIPGRDARRGRGSMRRTWFPSPSSISATRKTEPISAGVSAFVVSANGEKTLYRQGPRLGHHGNGRAGEAGRRRAQPGSDGGLCRPARRVESDLPRGLADRTGFPL